MAFVSVVGCAGSKVVTAATSSTQSATIIYGAPPSATSVAAVGTLTERVLNVRFVGADGRNYLIHTGPAPMLPASPDPARAGTGQLIDHTPATLACGGTSSNGRSDINGSVVTTGPTPAGPLTVEWQAGDRFVTVLSQDDTGPCTPSTAAAAPLFQLISTLPRLTEADWTQLVADHPISLTDSGSGDGSVSVTGPTASG